MLASRFASQTFDSQPLAGVLGHCANAAAGLLYNNILWFDLSARLFFKMAAENKSVVPEHPQPSAEEAKEALNRYRSLFLANSESDDDDDDDDDDDYIRIPSDSPNYFHPAFANILPSEDEKWRAAMNLLSNRQRIEAIRKGASSSKQEKQDLKNIIKEFREVYGVHLKWWKQTVHRGINICDGSYFEANFPDGRPKIPFVESHFHLHGHGIVVWTDDKDLTEVVYVMLHVKRELAKIVRFDSLINGNNLPPICIGTFAQRLL